MLVVMVMVFAMALMGVGVLVSASKYLSSANAATTSVGLSSCAQAVRQYLAAQSAAGSLGNLSLTVPSTGTPITLQGGHYENISTLNFALPSSPSSFGSRLTATTQNLANALPMNIGGGTTTTGAAVCTDSNGRTYEVEFSLIGP
jgi:type II secretory pathway pseudopilin PulG